VSVISYVLSIKGVMKVKTTNKHSYLCRERHNI